MAHDPFLDSSRLDSLIQRVLDGDATPAERDLADAILAECGVPADWATTTVQVLRSPDTAAQYDSERLRVGVWNQIDAAGTRRASHSAPVPRSWTAYGRFIRVFVAAVLVVAGVLTYRREFARPPRAVRRTYETTSGMFAAVALSDGGQILLAPRSRLTIETIDGVQHRVQMEGEAHFDITSHASAPFEVKTGAVTTRVLGTTFDIHRYPGDTVGRVVVYSGRVSTRGRGDAVTLAAGMAARFTDSLVTATDIPPDVSTDWRRHQLVFRAASVATVLATLAQWYDYEFQLTDTALAARHVTAVFPIGESTQMLKYVQHVLGVSMQFNGTVVTLRPERDAAPPPATRTRALPPNSEFGR